MYDFVDRLKRELADIDFLIRETEARIDPSFQPEGYLEPKRRGGKIVYFLVLRDSTGGRFRRLLGAPDSPEVQNYKAQRFLRERLKILRADRKEVVRLLARYRSYAPDDIHAALPSAYKDLPAYCYEDSRCTKLVDWAKEMYTKNGYALPANANRACDGTKLRSKGEIVGYDNLKARGIPFRNDNVIGMHFADGHGFKLCPDYFFYTFSGEYLVWEHWGMLLDAEYAASQVDRLQKYLQLGYVLGENLFITSDNAEDHTNSQAICDVIEFIEKKIRNY